jgi:hypothetical protein
MSYKPTKFDDKVNVTNPNHKAEFLRLGLTILAISLVAYLILSLTLGSCAA